MRLNIDKQVSQMTEKTIAEIDINKKVIISKVCSTADQKEDLENLGFVPGTHAEVIAKTPFSGPLAIEIRGTRIALRKKDATCILVQSQ